MRNYTKPTKNKSIEAYYLHQRRQIMELISIYNRMMTEESLLDKEHFTAQMIRSFLMGKLQALEEVMALQH